MLRLATSDFAHFLAGDESALHKLLGAHPCERDGVPGTRFSVWAPRARAVHVMGSFNGWDASRHPMSPVGDAPGSPRQGGSAHESGSPREAGVWELFVPGAQPGDLYKFQVRSQAGSEQLAVDKADPMARGTEVRPASASRIVSADPFPWSDGEWLSGREERTRPGAPLSIYEAHAGSWRRNPDGSWLGYRALAGQLLPYVAELGFTHIELLPVTEHPYDESWGYQTTGYFAPTARYGPPEDFAYFVDRAHELGLGVLLDWVPGHFAPDAFGLRQFDGAPLYEKGYDEQAAHPDWGSLVFDYGRPEVVSFLLSSARYWIERFHIDGLRVDAVASMLYLDYSRAEGEWEANEFGGRENLEAIAFLRSLATMVGTRHPGVLLFAEESTAWAGVTAPVDQGGLGFDFKWNMGWMNDTLAVLGATPERRRQLHDRLTFSIHYAYEERHLLPLSHDEVVHCKGALFSKTPGSEEDKFAGLRLLLGYMWTHPGAKLLFMGGEIGQPAEWDEGRSLEWGLLDHARNRGVRRWVRALNDLYRREPALHARDHEPEGFEWLHVHDAERSVLAYLRWRPGWEDFVAVVANFSGTAWRGYKVALPAPGRYKVVLDSGDPRFGGEGRTALPQMAEETEYLSRPAALEVDLPRFGFLALQRQRRSRPEDRRVPSEERRAGAEDRRASAEDRRAGT